MSYLCPKHAAAIRQNSELAMGLWRGAMSNGSDAFKNADWASARGFFGAAYETALMYRWSMKDCAPSGEHFEAKHLLDAGKLLSRCLTELGLWEEAQVCLLTLQSDLLQENRANTKRRALAIAITQDYLNQLIASSGLEMELNYSSKLSQPIEIHHQERAVEFPGTPTKALH